MTCSDPSLPVDGSNLCLKAADAWAVEWARETAGVALHLEKRVPYGAGLGSGSSDAATTLRLVDRLWATRGGEHRLSVVAAALGSDVPFFLGPPVARGTGRGEILEPLDVPSLAEFTFVVAVPSIHVATGPAYGMVTPSDAKRPDLAGIVARADLDEWRARLVNDFQRPVMAAYPGIAPVLQALDRHGAGHAGLSGSGSSVYGVFTSQAAAREAASECQALGCTAWTGGLDDAPSG